MINVKIVADSVSSHGARITTFVLTYPRFIHSEFMTHRMFSRNASSSRAIPVKKQIQMVIDNPAIPIAFRKNQKGMQAGELVADQEYAKMLWLQARDFAVTQAEEMIQMDIHKQYANRILEPFAHISVVCTATEYDNFFALRYHSAAQPEICELAKLMWECRSDSKPVILRAGFEWHLPFVPLGQSFATIEEGIKMSVARCARVSYLNHEGKSPTKEEDFGLYDRLLGNAPIHASPAEHQATPLLDANEWSGNFRGWKQYRKTLTNENVSVFVGPDRQS